jgi:hypothetical protein
MAKGKYKVGDKVLFTFLSQPLEGIILEELKGSTPFTQYSKRYLITDGRTKYPTTVENIKNKIK